MVNAYINKVGMYLVVITVLDKFNAVISTIPAFAKLVTSFKSLTASISKVSEEADSGTTGKTKVKQSAASAMAETVASLVGILHAYACDIQDEDLMDRTEVAETDIIHTRDAKRASYATSLVDLVEANKAGLAEWGVTDEDIAEARQAIADYESSLGTRDSTKTAQKGERESIEAMIARADRMLYRQLDKMVGKQKTKTPDFYAEYQAARVIRDIAATRKGKTPAPAPASGASSPAK